MQYHVNGLQIWRIMNFNTLHCYHINVQIKLGSGWCLDDIELRARDKLIFVATKMTGHVDGRYYDTVDVSGCACTCTKDRMYSAPSKDS